MGQNDTQMNIKPGDLVHWADDHLLLINKPSGLLTLPDGYDPTLPHLKSILEPEYGRLWIIHRLDRGTSGIIVLGRSKAAHRHLNTQFEERLVEKRYHALVVGNPIWEEKQVDLPLRPDGDRLHRTIPDSTHGKASRTDFRVLGRFNTFALLEAVPKTGRTHQIRTHLRAINLPLIGDHLYGEPDHPLHNRLSRLGLHAKSISFTHPHTKAQLTFEAPYPKDFSQVLSSPFD